MFWMSNSWLSIWQHNYSGATSSKSNWLMSQFAPRAHCEGQKKSCPSAQGIGSSWKKYSAWRLHEVLAGAMLSAWDLGLVYVGLQTGGVRHLLRSCTYNSIEHNSLVVGKKRGKLVKLLAKKQHSA